MADALPQRMKAAVYHAPHKLEVEQQPLPALGPRDVLVDVSHCGICGTDLHLVLEGMGRPRSIGGHEYSGRIVELGTEVSAWARGDRVVARPGKPPCGRCEFCRVGRTSLCATRDRLGAEAEYQGAFAEYVRVHEEQLYRVPEGLSLRVAALTEPMAVVLHAITLSEIRPRQRALITGAGPIGSFTLAALRARGMDDITVSEPSPVRRALAQRLGATRTVEPEELERPAMPDLVSEDAYHVAFECSGQPAAIQTALAQLERGGRLVLVGTGMKRPKLDHNRVLLNELVLTGAYNYDASGFEAALALLASGKVPADLLLEAEDVPLEGMLAAMERLAAGQLGGKVLVAPSGRREHARDHRPPA